MAGLLCVAATAFAGEPADDSSSWPQFRGPGGLGHIKGNVPVAWSNEKNVAWKTAIPGKAWSSPVVALGKAWLSTAVADKAGGTSLRLIGVDLKSGEIKHDVELFAAAKLPALRGQHARITDPRGGRQPCDRVVRGRWRRLRRCPHGKGVVAKRHAQGELPDRGSQFPCAV